LAREDESGGVLWGLADNLGSIRLVTDSEGSIVNEIVYDTFGNVVLESSEAIEFRFGYTGQELDEETGLSYYGARYYDAAVGEFISEDTIGFEGGDVNLYRYVSNSPTNYTDPSGNFRLSLGPPPVTSPSPVTPPPGVGVGTGAAAGTEAGLGAAIGGGLLLAAATVGFWLLMTESVADATLGQDKNLDNDDDSQDQPDVKNPNCPPKTKSKKTCNDRPYNEYDPITKAVGYDKPFGGYEHTSLKLAIDAMQQLRENRLDDDRPLISQRKEKEGSPMRYPQFKDPKQEAKHFNIFIKELLKDRKSAGSIGLYKFCFEGDPPEILPRYGILNIKDRDDTFLE
jgi:RHS repeat-associated protein